MNFRSLLLLLTLAGLASAPLAAQDTLEAALEQNAARSSFGRLKKAPALDPKRIVNESYSFLKEREPEMNGEEYALYEKVVTMMTTNPAFALRMLEGMMGDAQKPSPAFQFMLGNAYYASGDNEQAEKNFRGALDRFPSFVRAWKNLGVVYYGTERFAPAAPCFSKAIVLGDREPATFGLLGYSLEQIGDEVSAELAYMQALAGDPAALDWKEGLLRIAIAAKQFGRAELLVRDLIRRQPKDTRFWLAYANILISQDRKLEALTVLETAAGTGIAQSEELQQLGDLYAEQDLPAEAVAVYRRLLSPSPALGEQRLLHLARVQVAAGQLADAEVTLAALPAEPTPAARLAWLQTRADLFAARRDWAACRREVETLLRLSPLDGRALLTLGQTYAEEDDRARARLAFESALQSDSGKYRAHLELANLCIKDRQYRPAVDHLEQALRLERTDAVADYLARVRALVTP